MKTALKAITLIAASLVCLYGFAWLAFSKGVRVSEAVDNTVAGAVLVSALLLPIGGCWCLRRQRGIASYCALLFPAFLISLAPAVVILCAFLVVLLVRPPE